MSLDITQFVNKVYFDTDKSIFATGAEGGHRVPGQRAAVGNIQ